MGTGISRHSATAMSAVLAVSPAIKSDWTALVAQRKADKAAKKKDEEFPLEVEADALGVHRRAHFYIARMHGKMLPLPHETGEARVRGLKASLKK